MSDDLVFNESAGRYEMDFDGALAYVNVRREVGVYYIDYVFMPAELRGSGATNQLMRAVLDEIRSQGVKVVPFCDYAALWIRRHGEYADLLE